MTELSKIAQKYSTDKGNTFINSHGYTEIYDQYLKKYKDENRKIYILEIGVQCGYDLLMINEYFEGNCEIYGFDIDLSKMQLDLPDNIHVFELNATDSEAVYWWFDDRYNVANNLCTIPMFDIIIDDGSHFSNDILKSLSIFHNKLANNGTYIIEDLHFENAKEALYFLNFKESPYNEEYQLNNVINKMASCTIYHNYLSYCDAYKPSICAILTFR